MVRAAASCWSAAAPTNVHAPMQLGLRFPLQLAAGAQALLPAPSRRSKLQNSSSSGAAAATAAAAGATSCPSRCRPNGRNSGSRFSCRAAGGPDTELPDPHQQTLRRSFTVGGVGLHTGEFAVVRVLPAFAGEGRYFVRVPPGTNSHLWEPQQPEARQLQEVGTSAGRDAQTSADDDLSAVLFFEFVQSQEDAGFAGTFSEFLQQRGAASPDALLIEAATHTLPKEEPSSGHADELRVPAWVDSLQPGHGCCSILAKGDALVWGAEHLLAALECCGVDDARIEVEGGKEVPIVDGSALGWASEIQRTGLRAAVTAASPAAVPIADGCPPKEMVTVVDGESFVSFIPGPYARVSVGVDYAEEAAVIGRQWFSWSPDDPGWQQEDSFISALAPARLVFPSSQAVRDLMKNGMLQGGPDYVSLIAHGDDWEDPTMVRFPSDEAARHAAVVLLGYLSLLAPPGGRGLQAGHVVAYRPTHTLLAAFLQRVQPFLHVKNEQ